MMSIPQQAPVAPSVAAPSAGSVRRRYHDAPKPGATMIKVQTDAGIATRWMTEEPICLRATEEEATTLPNSGDSRERPATISQNAGTEPLPPGAGVADKTNL